jgi:hypothetical protein
MVALPISYLAKSPLGGVTAVNKRLLVKGGKSFKAQNKNIYTISVCTSLRKPRGRTYVPVSVLLASTERVFILFKLSYRKTGLRATTAGNLYTFMSVHR